MHAQALEDRLVEQEEAPRQMQEIVQQQLQAFQVRATSVCLRSIFRLIGRTPVCSQSIGTRVEGAD